MARSRPLLLVTHNPAGQITARTSSNDRHAWTGHGNADRAYGVNGLNQVTGAGSAVLGHDARGNLASGLGEGYGYDSFDRLGEHGGGQGQGRWLYYDALGRLLWVNTEATRFDHDGGRVVTELDGRNDVRRRYVYGPGGDEPVVWFEGAGTGDKRFLAADERGSVVRVSRADGSALAVNTYDEFGRPGAANLGRFQYTGQKWLPTLGLYDYKARMYHPGLGRFMQPDPIGYADGLNLYDYVGGDPVNQVDPGGLAAQDAGVGADSLPPMVDDVVVTGKRLKSGGLGSGSLSNGRSAIPAINLLPPAGNGGAPGISSTVNRVAQCALDQFGVTGLLDAGTAALGIPQEGTKRFVTPGSSKGTSALSEGLARLFPQRIGNTGLGRSLGISRIWTPRWGHIGRYTPVVGRAVGRLIPIVGAVLLAKDAIQIAKCSIKE